MSKEQYVSFEVAKLLKQKEFDWEVRSLYGKYEDDIGFSSWSNNYNTYDDLYSAPTQQMACDWVEKTYGFFIEVSRHIDINGNYHYLYMILDKECKYASSGTHDNNYPSKYEAVESALEYVLTNII